VEGLPPGSSTGALGVDPGSGWAVGVSPPRDRLPTDPTLLVVRLIRSQPQCGGKKPLRTSGSSWRPACAEFARQPQALYNRLVRKSLKSLVIGKFPRQRGQVPASYRNPFRIIATGSLGSCHSVAPSSGFLTAAPGQWPSSTAITSVAF
jgi:hypothetical protein